MKQVVVREFFAYLPVRTNDGWAWLCDVRKVLTEDPTCWPSIKIEFHYERVRARS